MGLYFFPSIKDQVWERKWRFEIAKQFRQKYWINYLKAVFFFFFMKMWHRRGLPGDLGACISSCGTILFRNRETIRLRPARLSPELLREARRIRPVCILGRRLAGSGSVLWWREEIKTSWRNWTPWRARFRGQEHEHSFSRYPSHLSGPFQPLYWLTLDKRASSFISEPSREGGCQAASDVGFLVTILCLWLFSTPSRSFPQIQIFVWHQPHFCDCLLGLGVVYESFHG